MDSNILLNNLEKINSTKNKKEHHIDSSTELGVYAFMWGIGTFSILHSVKTSLIFLLPVGGVLLITILAYVGCYKQYCGYKKCEDSEKALVDQCLKECNIDEKKASFNLTDANVYSTSQSLNPAS
ncbi:hypothetical protein [Wolbachia endosymbiont of Pentidionis agamae]|uniref:hypothetical protein n=1 Tax=Wolbachia endosymbiont of Pentidionis agamae TaxID=3110435 RepID=UPI002FD2FFA2